MACPLGKLKPGCSKKAFSGRGRSNHNFINWFSKELPAAIMGILIEYHRCRLKNKKKAAKLKEPKTRKSREAKKVINRIKLVNAVVVWDSAKAKAALSKELF